MPRHTVGCMSQQLRAHKLADRRSDGAIPTTEAVTDACVQAWLATGWSLASIETPEVRDLFDLLCPGVAVPRRRTLARRALAAYGNSLGQVVAARLERAEPLAGAKNPALCRYPFLSGAVNKVFV